MFPSTLLLSRSREKQAKICAISARARAGFCFSRGTISLHFSVSIRRETLIKASLFSCFVLFLISPTFLCHRLKKLMDGCHIMNLRRKRGERKRGCVLNFFGVLLLDSDWLKEGKKVLFFRFLRRQVALSSFCGRARCVFIGH